MDIQFVLGWHNQGKSLDSAFKQKSALDLSHEYKKRISQFTVCELTGFPKLRGATPLAGWRQALDGNLWVCERAKKAKILSSEDLARELQKVTDTGIRKLTILIGPPNGFSEEELGQVKADLRWSFGPMTLPHELASVVAIEQLYRAFTINRRHPYHLGH